MMRRIIDELFGKFTIKLTPKKLIKKGSAPKILIAIYNYFVFRFVPLCVGGKASKIFSKSFY